MELEARISTAPKPKPTGAVSKVERIKSSARLRLRVADVLNAALEITGVRRSELARRLGIDRASVTQTLGGNGNITVNTLADYLAAMGLEADIQVVEHGEILCSMREHRAPKVFELTVRDTHRRNQSASLTTRMPNSSGTRQIPSNLQYRVSDSNLLAVPEVTRQTPPQNSEFVVRLETRAS